DSARVDTSAIKPDSSRAAPDTSRAQPDTSRVDSLRAQPDTTRAARPDTTHVPVVSAPDSARAALFGALVGTWGGTVEHEGVRESFAFGFAPGQEGRMEIYLSMPVAHLDRVPFGNGRPVAEGDSVRIGALRFALDRAHGEISGRLPAGLVPYYKIPFRLKRVDH